MKRVPILTFFLLLVLAFSAKASNSAVRVDFFSVPGCDECLYIHQKVLPALKMQCTGLYYLVEYDLNEETNYLRLVEIQERLGQIANEPVYMAVDDRILLSGLSQIQTGLVPAVKAASLSSPAELPPASQAPRSPPSLKTRMAGFKSAAVFCAGVADGLNPCAMASLVFLMGLLASSRIKGRTLALSGFLFCLASFITYFLLGLGLLESLRALSRWAGLKVLVNRALAATLLILAWLSFRDAVRFRKGEEAENLSVKLPGFLRERIKRLSKNEIRTRPIAWASLVLGCLVTLIESVCTGQLYVPTLAWMAKSSPEQGRALSLLGLYNLGFIIPLTAVFGVMLGGSSVFSLLGWQQRHIVRSKILLGLLFLALALGLAMSG